MACMRYFRFGKFCKSHAWQRPRERMRASDDACAPDFGFRRTSLGAILAAASLACCMQATDPGLNERYTVEFSSPASVAGKKFHWTTMPVKIKYNACQVAGCSASIEAAVRKGIDFWKRNASLYGEIQTEYAESGDIEVKYVSSLGGNTIGVCSASLGQYSNGVMVAIKPLSLTIATTVGGGAISDAEFEFVSAHEMGHCLGLWEHSPRNGDLMYYLLTDKTGYSPRDLNSMRWLYSQKTDVGTYPASAAMGAEITAAGIAVSPPLTWP